MNVKKIMLSLIAGVAGALLIGSSAMAANVIEVGAGKDYETWSEAVAAAVADGDGEITYKIYGDVEIDTAGYINPVGTSGADVVNIIGGDADAEIILTSTNASIFRVDIGAINFENITLTKTNPFTAYDYAHANNYFTTWSYGKDSEESVSTVTTYTNCVFTNGASNDQFGTTNYVNCTFNNTKEYALWIYTAEDAVTNVTGCEFEAKKGIKIYSEDASARATTNITSCVFDITSKPAIVSSIGGTVTVTKVDASACQYGLLANEYKDHNSSYERAIVTVDGKAPAYVAGINGELYTNLNYATEEAGSTKPLEVFAVKVDDEYYADLATALKAVEENSVVTLLADITIAEDWDNRNTGAKIAVPVTIDGNDHTITFTGTISDGYNYLSVFRFENDAIVKNLTIDLSDAKSGWEPRLRAISSKGNLTIENCIFIGNPQYTNTRAVIFGEGAGDAAADLSISVENSVFTDWKRGLGDNENGQDVKTVTITGNTFTNAGISVSASDEITLTENTVTNGDVTITSYADVTTLNVVANNNNIDKNAENYINANVIITDSVDDFDLPVAEIEGKKFISLAAAVKAVEKNEEAVITVIDDLEDETLTIKGDVTIKPAASTDASLAADDTTTLNNVIFNVEKDASLAIEGLTIEGLSYIYAKEPDSISVIDCDINVGVVEVSGTNCPPAFVLFSSSNNGSVEFTFTDNTLLATPDETEDWYTYNHGIAGWNSIEKATIKNNVFGSKNAPLGAAAVKLMNFVDGAIVEVSGNTFHVESKDSTWGPDAIQFYQNNSRGNDYFVSISDNDFFVDDATAAIGINTNAMGNPVDNAGGATVEIALDNTVNGKELTITDVIVFGNGINDQAYTRGYVGIGVEKDANGDIIGGWFNKYSLGLEDALSAEYSFTTDAAGYIKVVEEGLVDVDSIRVEFKDVTTPTAEGEKLYNINLVANNDKIINRLNSVDLTFVFTQIFGTNDFEIIASNSEIAITPVNNSKVRYEFHYEGKDNALTDTDNTITIGQVKFTGYGKFTFAVDASADETNAAHATEAADNIVDTFIQDGVIANGEGILDVSDDKIKNILISAPTRNLTINLTFPNAVENKITAYQQMKVVISGGDLANDIVVNLGSDAEMPTIATDVKPEAKVEVTENSVYQIVLTKALTVNTSYTVTVSGAGYRTTRYTVTMTDAKILNFWNNVKDNETAIEEGKKTAKTTFLAGDIVKDGKINIYDLSAVVSYFGEVELVGNNNAYAKYDLNRDGKIDSKDVAYVLVSWNN